MSIPAGILLEKFTEKPVLIVSFALAVDASLFFAMMPLFHVAIVFIFFNRHWNGNASSCNQSVIKNGGRGRTFRIFFSTRTIVFGLASYISPNLFLPCYEFKTASGS